MNDKAKKMLIDHEIRIKALEDEPLEQNHEDRIGALEEVALILRAKIEPETLTTEAIERAHTIAREREEPDAIDQAEKERLDRRC